MKGRKKLFTTKQLRSSVAMFNMKIDDCKKVSSGAFANAKKEFEKYHEHFAGVVANWIVGDYSTDVYRAAIEQISECTLNIMFQKDLHFAHWVERLNV